MPFWKKKTITPQLKKTITTQFWVGKFATEALFYEFVGEDPAHYAEENEDKDYPLSKFSASQGEWFYDHDFMEVAFSAEAIQTSEQFMASWVDKWADELDRRIKKHGIANANTLVMMVVDKSPNRDPYRQITNPVSVSDEGFELVYLGEIEHDDYDK